MPYRIIRKRYTGGGGALHPIARWMQDQKKTQTEAARAFRCRQATVSKIVNFRLHPGRTLALRMSKVTGIPLETILFPPRRRRAASAEVSP